MHVFVYSFMVRELKVGYTKYTEHKSNFVQNFFFFAVFLWFSSDSELHWIAFISFLFFFYFGINKCTFIFGVRVCTHSVWDLCMSIRPCVNVLTSKQSEIRAKFEMVKQRYHTVYKIQHMYEFSYFFFFSVLLCFSFFVTAWILL